MSSVIFTKVFEQSEGEEIKQLFRKYKIDCEYLSDDTISCIKCNKRCFIRSLKLEQLPSKNESIAICEGSSITYVPPSNPTKKSVKQKAISSVSPKKKHKKYFPNVEQLEKIDPHKPMVPLTPENRSKIKSTKVVPKATNIFQRYPNATIVQGVPPVDPKKIKYQRNINQKSRIVVKKSPENDYTKVGFKLKKGEKRVKNTISPRSYRRCWRCGAPCYGGTHYCFEHLKENNEY